MQVLLALEQLEQNEALTSEVVVLLEDDVLLSFQEEYVGEDEVGRLPCEHLYHATCVEQWLRQKNWCPICKSSALRSRKSG
ncbi:hypothetical protein GW17_00052768 [Ensete ventricosum]|nr:hypothetical protein GW17_00052768 [Ensete ventricosum]